MNWQNLNFSDIESSLISFLMVFLPFVIFLLSVTIGLTLGKRLLNAFGGADIQRVNNIEKESEIMRKNALL